MYANNASSMCVLYVCAYYRSILMLTKISINKHENLNSTVKFYTKIDSICAHEHTHIIYMYISVSMRYDVESHKFKFSVIADHL